MKPDEKASTPTEATKEEEEEASAADDGFLLP